MKIILILLLTIIGLTGFTNISSDHTKYRGLLTELEWGPWQKISCYRGIQFRTIRGRQEDDGSYWWSVQFRNLYDRKVRFNYNITEPEKEEKVKKEKLILDTWSLGINQDPEKEGNDAPHAGNYVRSADKVFLYITDVRFPTEGNWSPDPIRCDY